MAGASQYESSDNCIKPLGKVLIFGLTVSKTLVSTGESPCTIVHAREKGRRTLSEDSSGHSYERLPFAISIADLEQDDAPLVYVNRAFEKLTGYSSESVLGRNCRFLQGEETDTGTVAELASAVAEGREVEATILNYRADGNPFWNRLTMAPLGNHSEDDSGRYFVGFQRLVEDRQEPADRATTTDQQLAEVQHRVKNHLSMIVSMIRIQAPRSGDVRDAFDTLARRVEALQLLYQEMDQAGLAKATDKIIPLGAYLGRIASAINHIDGRKGVKLNFTSETLTVPVETAGRIGLVVSEIITNSMQHAFADRDRGVVEVRCKTLSDDLLRITIEDDGAGLPEDCNWPHEGNLGARIVRELLKGMNAKLDLSSETAGTTINIDIPLNEQAELIDQHR